MVESSDQSCAVLGSRANAHVRALIFFPLCVPPVDVKTGNQKWQIDKTKFIFELRRVDLTNKNFFWGQKDHSVV